MNQYVTGNVIKQLREKNNMTQLQLADKLSVSDKTISKWETGKGYPDITLLEPISNVFKVSVTELISGNTVFNKNVCANMMKSHFYVCPICGNVIHSMGESVIECHGIQLLPLSAEPLDDNHKILVDFIEDDLYIKINHEMAKDHYISFAAAASPDRMQIVKLYPEGEAETRFKRSSVRRVYFYCNRDGLFYLDIKRDIEKL